MVWGIKSLPIPPYLRNLWYLSLRTQNPLNLLNTKIMKLLLVSTLFFVLISACSRKDRFPQLPDRSANCKAVSSKIATNPTSGPWEDYFNTEFDERGRPVRVICQKAEVFGERTEQTYDISYPDSTTAILTGRVRNLIYIYGDDSSIYHTTPHVEADSASQLIATFDPSTKQLLKLVDGISGDTKIECIFQNGKLVKYIFGFTGFTLDLNVKFDSLGNILDIRAENLNGTSFTYDYSRGAHRNLHYEPAYIGSHYIGYLFYLVDAIGWTPASHPNRERASYTISWGGDPEYNVQTSHYDLHEYDRRNNLIKYSDHGVTLDENNNPVEGGPIYPNPATLMSYECKSFNFFPKVQ